jgi:hypothetical protein
MERMAEARYALRAGCRGFGIRLLFNTQKKGDYSKEQYETIRRNSDGDGGPVIRVGG